MNRPPRRIGILTFHYVINEGAVLQTYALFIKLHQLFRNDIVEVIDYRTVNASQAYWKYIASNTKSPRIMFQRASRCRRLRNFISQNVTLSSTRLTSDDYEVAVNFLKDKYDLIVVGSDEIWTSNDSLFPFPNIYWLSETLNCHKIAYAVSANKRRYRESTCEERGWMKKQLDAYDLIGVRDNHTFDMAQSLGLDDPSKIVKVPDPTFTLPPADVDVRAFLEQRGLDLTRPVLGITFCFPDINREILELFKARGYQTVGITVSNPDVDLNLVGQLDPFQWSRIYHFFSLCLTNLFHGTVFSLKAGIPFLSFDYFSRSNQDYETKLKCLLDEFQLSDRYVPAQDFSGTASQILCQVDKVLTSHDPVSVQTRLDEASQTAERFFDEARRRLSW